MKKVSLTFSAIQENESKTLLNGKVALLTNELNLSELNVTNVHGEFKKFVGFITSNYHTILTMVNPKIEINLFKGEQKENVFNLKKQQIASIKGGGENALKFGVFVVNLINEVNNLLNSDEIQIKRVFASLNFEDKGKTENFDSVQTELNTVSYLRTAKKLAIEIKTNALKDSISEKVNNCKRLQSNINRLIEKAKTQQANEKAQTLQKVKEYKTQLATLQNSIPTNLLSY